MSLGCTSNIHRCNCHPHSGQQCRQQVRLYVSRQPPLADPPAFDLPEREPTREEAQFVAQGATLTPEQQLAQKLQLPLTQRVRLPPKVPSPRQLMAQIQVAQTWQELEAVIYQKQPVPTVQQPDAEQQLQQQQQQQYQQQVTQDASLLPAASVAAPVAEQQQPQQRKQRRKQPLPMLSLPSSSSSSRNSSQPVQPLGPDKAALPAGIAEVASPVHQQLTGAASTASPVAGAGSLQQQGQQQLLQQPPEPLLNHLHVTEAFRRLPSLLPPQPTQLPPSGRQRVANLISFLCQQASQHAQSLTLDDRGIAHVALGLSKLGQKDPAFMAELQLAALVRVEEFSSRHLAMFLMALVGLDVRPDPELMQALQQHISNTLHLFEEQSLSNTIWALAKLSKATHTSSANPASITTASTTPKRSAAAAAAPAGSSGSIHGGSGSGDVARGVVRGLMHRCDPQMLRWSGRHLAQAAWGLAQLRARPNAAWGQSLLAACESQLHKMNTQDLANVLSALPRLNVLPDQAWINSWCRSATAKMYTASPVGVYSLLFDLARLKQAQHKAAAYAQKRQEQQQQPTAQQQQQQGTQQQQGLPPTTQQTAQQLQEALQQQQPEMPAIPDALDTTTPGGSAAAVAVSNRSAAGGAAVSPSAGIGACAVSTLEELQVLRAAVRWLQQHPGTLSNRQLSGVVTALAELLPARPQEEQEPPPASQAVGKQDRQQRHEQQDTLGQHAGNLVAEQHNPQEHHERPVQQPVSLSKASAEDRRWLQAQQHLEEMLPQLLMDWAQRIEGLTKGIGKPRQARFVKLAWQRLVTQYGGANLENGQP